MKIVFNKIEVKEIIRTHACTLVDPSQLSGMKVVVSETTEGKYEARFLEKTDNTDKIEDLFERNNTRGGDTIEDNRS
jgi:hypothetical protein